MNNATIQNILKHTTLLSNVKPCSFYFVQLHVNLSFEMLFFYWQQIYKSLSSQTGEDVWCMWHFQIYQYIYIYIYIYM